MIGKGKIPREEGFLRGYHAIEKGAWKFWGFHTRLCSLNLQRPKSFLAAARKTVVYIYRRRSFLLGFYNDLKGEDSPGRGFLEQNIMQ